MLTCRTLSEPVEMNSVGRWAASEMEPRKRIVASARTPNFVRRSRSTNRIVGE
jgi:hypothetical protein